MTFLEWRRFNFFSIQEDSVFGKNVPEPFGDIQIVGATSGNGLLIIGDVIGFIHMVDRFYEITSFKAYENTLTLVHQISNCPYLFTIGEDEPGCNPTIKVWSLDKKDKQGNPLCIRISRAIPSYKAIAATTLCVHSSLTLMAVGFEDGSIMLYRGDLTRERKNKIKVLKDSNMKITGLAIHVAAKQSYLYVTTTNNAYLYNITVRDKETKSLLDDFGCALKCSIFAESKQDGQFMVGRSDAIYCYTPDGRGPCYAIDGKKTLLKWFRNYLVIITEGVEAASGTVITPKLDAQPGIVNNTITILDIQNKFIVFAASLPSIEAVLSEWGGLFVLSGDCKLYRLEEKDLQSKLNLLFKKNLYDISIRIAKNHHYDVEGLADIFRLYGDHLHSKGDYNGAIEQYVKTIGILEPSYVIKKYLNSQHIDYLIIYLQALHKQGQATGNHTTLLLNCYTKLNHSEELRNFIMTKDRKVDFDVEIAIKVCRHCSPEDALMLAQKHEKHEWYLRIQIEDKAEYKKALDYIGTLKFEEADLNMKKYGKILIENIPNDATQFLKILCTKYVPNNSNEQVMEHNVEKADPEDYIHLFLNNSEHLIEFLEYLIKNDNGVRWSTLVYNTLIEHYLHGWSNSNDELLKSQHEQKIIRLLQTSHASFDRDQILILCHQHDFRKGVLLLYEEKKLYQEILRYHLQKGDPEKVLATCNNFGNQDPHLWVQTLWTIASKNMTSSKLLLDVLDHIAKEKLLAPLTVLDALSTSLTSNLKDIRHYLNNVLSQEQEQVQADTELIEKYRRDSKNLRQKMHEIENDTIIFQGSRCSACHHQLELPSVHFLCNHSYHQHCFQSFSENENECPACMPTNKKWLDIIKAQEQSKDFHETFHCLIDRTEEPFSLIADYFGHNVFKQIMVIAEWQKSQTIAKMVNDQCDMQMYDFHKSEVDSQYTLKENKSTSRPIEVDNIKTYQSTLEPSGNPLKLSTTPRSQHSNLEQLLSNSPGSSKLKVDNSTLMTSSAEKKFVLPTAPMEPSNPFKEDYDESKNPFADEFEDDDPNNPFFNDS
ncbi:hypothetical protein TKK_0013397 [Trichogramma kaykai]|uniref:Vacuolar protein sorting-associated protein 11 homolog n=1 Tax=Trichogramma kaykai TaxID=54128 RepID=A0ABD2WIH4_9HYME